jgi:Short-chain dehydrogenases of various substrate specificities
MDMGIKGRKAIVCAASKGLGKGCAMALAGEGVDLVINARTKSDLEATAEEIRKKHGVKVTPVAVDVTTDGRSQTGAGGSAPSLTSSSTMPVARRRATSAIGIAMRGSRRSTPTC